MTATNSDDSIESNDEGYVSTKLHKGKQIEIESALETLVSRRNEVLHESSSSSSSSSVPDATTKSWDEVYENVERFSHNTTVLLSWIDEFKEIQQIKFDDSRDKRPPVAEWSEQVISHVDRIYSEVMEDGARLLESNLPPEERSVVERIVDDVSGEYKLVAPGWWGSGRSAPAYKEEDRRQRSLPLQERSEDRMRNEEMCDPLPSCSALIYEHQLEGVDEREDYVSKDAHRVRLWWKLVCERERCVAWLSEVQRKVDVAATYHPYRSLRNLYQQHLAEVRHREERYGGGEDSTLGAIASCVGELFPELRHRARTLVYDTRHTYERLEERIRTKLADLDPDPQQTPIPHARHVFRSYSPDYRRRRHHPSSPRHGRARCDDTLDNSHHQLSDFSFKQIRDQLGALQSGGDDSLLESGDREDQKGAGRSEEEEHIPGAGAATEVGAKSSENLSKSSMEDPISLSKEAIVLHTQIKKIEEEAIDCFSGKPIGWDPELLDKFLTKNKATQDELACQRRALEAFESAAVSYLLRGSPSSSRRRQLIDDASLRWALLMLQQRHSTLMLFCLDVQCLLERRLDVIHLLDKKIAVNNLLRHPTDNMWTELAVDIKLDAQARDEDYNLIRNTPLEQ